MRDIILIFTKWIEDNNYFRDKEIYILFAIIAVIFIILALVFYVLFDVNDAYEQEQTVFNEDEFRIIQLNCFYEYKESVLKELVGY